MSFNEGMEPITDQRAHGKSQQPGDATTSGTPGKEARSRGRNERQVKIVVPHVAAFQAEGNRIAAKKVYVSALEEAELFQRKESEHYGQSCLTLPVWERAWSRQTAPALGCYFAAAQLAAESAEVFLKVLWSEQGTIPVSRDHNLVNLWMKVSPTVRGLVSAESDMPSNQIEEVLGSLKDVHTKGRYLGEFYALEIGKFRAQESFALLAALATVTGFKILEFGSGDLPPMKECLNCKWRMDAGERDCPSCGMWVWNDEVPILEDGMNLNPQMIVSPDPPSMVRGF